MALRLRSVLVNCSFHGSILPRSRWTPSAPGQRKYRQPLPSPQSTSPCHLDTLTPEDCAIDGLSRIVHINAVHLRPGGKRAFRVLLRRCFKARADLVLSDSRALTDAKAVIQGCTKNLRSELLPGWFSIFMISSPFFINVQKFTDFIYRLSPVLPWISINNL